MLSLFLCEGRKMEEFIIRHPKENDFLIIAELAEKCPPMATERNSIYHIFTKYFKNTCLVAVNGNKIVAFLLGFISQVNRREGYLHLLCVHPQWRKKGIAKVLVDKYCHILRQNGCRKVILITSPKNSVAINLYKKLGFKAYNGMNTIQIGDIRVFKDYNGKDDHKVIFQKMLDSIT